MTGRAVDGPNGHGVDFNNDDGATVHQHAGSTFDTRTAPDTGQRGELEGNYTIPFIVWAPEATPGADLYALNPTTRRNPGSVEVGLEGVQPIRGHEVGNLALDLLGLPAIPGSVFNADFDLALR